MTNPLTPPPMTRERIQHVYDTHVGDPTEKLPHTPTDWEDFAQAVATARDAQWAARVAELERDAARYRWLRKQPNDTKAPRIDVVFWSEMDVSANSGDGLRLEALDAAIDAALSSEGKGAKG